MPWAIFTRPFGYDYRPEKGLYQYFEASPKPQQVKRVVLDAALKRGAAKEHIPAKTPTPKP